MYSWCMQYIVCELLSSRWLVFHLRWQSEINVRQTATSGSWQPDTCVCLHPSLRVFAVLWLFSLSSWLFRIFHSTSLTFDVKYRAYFLLRTVFLPVCLSVYVSMLSAIGCRLYCRCAARCSANMYPWSWEYRPLVKASPVRICSWRPRLVWMLLLFIFTCIYCFCHRFL